MNTHLIRTMGAVPALLACLAGQAQTPSALNAREFDKHWTPVWTLDKRRRI